MTPWCGEKIRGGPVSIYSCGGYFILVESATSRFSKTRAVTSRSRKFMASISLFSSKTLVSPSATYLRISSSSSTSHSCCLGGCRCSFPIKPLSTSNLIFGRRRTGRQVVRMAPEEEKLTRRNPLDFPIVSFSLFSSFIFLQHFMFFFSSCNGILFCEILVLLLPVFNYFCYSTPRLVRGG